MTTRQLKTPKMPLLESDKKVTVPDILHLEFK